jgi:hypothetical protein
MTLAGRGIIQCNAFVPDPKSEIELVSTGLLGAAPSRSESKVAQVRPLGAAEETPVEMALGR